MQTMQVDYLIPAIVLFIIAIILWIIHDYKEWKKEKPIDHKKEWKLKAVSLIPSAIFFTVAHSQYWSILIILPMLAFSWWNLFDGIYNLLRKFNWLYSGSDDTDDAHTDDFLQAHPVSGNIIKISGAIVFIGSYIFTMA